ncbi:MAG: exodeoxyribonuclease VII large subunit [Candidatus Omnitrophica bacterium]|nr:exodeoxyribonuclease VII large subunit [Candidatus Omnitrophota bacterium]MBU1038103.1 exodeoxyribonuclease VII large subunit [Candidatus Omnitrophota bacterium]MBU1808217.1 exodeoxyribonuclease VII large subunit [Candidatus Omnitrophota bacterium]
MISETKEKQIYTVTELTKYIRQIVENSFPNIWVEGEISNFILHSSGHMYFSLKDAGSVVQCAMFKRSNEKLKFRPKDGMKAICFGKISVYEPRGSYQLIVEEIEPKGVGALQLQFQQLKERLQKEGLFDPAHKVPIPQLPTRIGIVTSPTGAAIRDILNIALRRFSNVEIIIYPVRVQGEGSKDEIASAIRDFNTLNNIDVMIVGRGGGSLEDLWAFNEEVVARAIYDSGIPVISAVGHEIDYTIADFVADLRAPTPSAAAELVIPRKEDLVNSINTNTVRLRNALLNSLGAMAQRLAKLSQSYALKQPLKMVEKYEQMIDDLRKDMAIRIDHLVRLHGENYNLLDQKLAVLSPLSILSRGYSVSSRLPEKKIIKDTGDIKVGDRIETRLGKGTFISKIEEIN